MQNFIQRGETLTLIAPAAVVSGQIVVVGSIVGVATTSAGSGASVECQLEGVFDLPKVTATAINAGDRAYWDSTHGYVTTTASGNTRIGAAVLGALSSATTVRVRLDGAHV
jgi:predicted RecA/RadA family phage recombinase